MLIFKQACIVITVLYFLVLLFVYFQQSSFIFFPTQARHELKNSDAVDYSFSYSSVKLKGWLVNEKAADQQLIIYYGGNAEDIFFSIGEFKDYTDTAALLINYRGYGTSNGKAGEEGFFADALAILDDVRQRYSPEKIYLMGRSLGSGVASYVASNRETSGIIMVTPFDSIESLARRQFPFFPTSLLLKHPFRSIEYVKDITCPSLIIYGGQDSIVPPASTRKLLNNFGAQTETIFIEEAGHNDIETFLEYKKAVRSFIR